MKYLLDTCIISGFVNGDSGILSRLKKARPDHLSISTLTIMEIEYGLQLNHARAARLAPAIRSLLELIEILPFSEADAKASAAIRASLKKKGNPIGPYDVLLAGCAMSRGLIMVTANVKEFARVDGLLVENWSTHFPS